MIKTTPSDFRPQTSDFILVEDYDVTPKSWTVYLICFDVVSCIVQDSCRA